MAVRNDFTAGEVLAAADLNDTFAAKADLASPTFTGTPAGPTAAAGTNTTQLATTAFVQGAGGLVLITTTTMSGSSVNVNSCFSATYDVYRIVAFYKTASDVSVGMRLRVGGTNNMSSVYTRQRLIASSTSITGVRTTSDSWNILSSSGSNHDMFVMDIAQPFDAAPTKFINTAQYADLGGSIFLTSGVHTESTSFDGFSVLPAAAFDSGSLSVYGYRK
jgi:hypothetical protein